MQLSLNYLYQVVANQSRCPPPEQQQIRIGILGDMRQLERSARGRQYTGAVMTSTCSDTVTEPGVQVLGKVAMGSSEVWTLSIVQPAGVSGNTRMDQVSGDLVTSDSGLALTAISFEKLKCPPLQAQIWGVHGPAVSAQVSAINSNVTSMAM